MSDSVKLGLIDLSVAEYRDGNCKRAKCQPNAYPSLVNQLHTFIKLEEEAENERTMYFETYGDVANITEDNFGYYIDFGNKIPNKTSVLEFDHV